MVYVEGGPAIAEAVSAAPRKRPARAAMRWRRLRFGARETADAIANEMNVPEAGWTSKIIAWPERSLKITHAKANRPFRGHRASATQVFRFV